MKTILLVDDSTTIRNVLKASMHTEYNIIESGSGDDALKAAIENEIDFFLLDVNIPKIDGITLTREIRKLSKYEKTPIVILTTETRSEKREAGKSAGANGWIVKPCDPSRLLSVIKKLI